MLAMHGAEEAAAANNENPALLPLFSADLDLESKLWLKIRLAPMCPWIGTLGLGFVGSPSSELLGMPGAEHSLFI